MDLQKMRDQQPYLNQRAKEEQLENFLLAIGQIEDFIEFERVKKKVLQSPRVLNNWVEQGVIDPIESGKKRTFNKLESIWFDIVLELKEFGIQLDKVKKVKEHLFDKRIGTTNFSPLKYTLIYSILIEPYILLIFKDGSVNLLPKSEYIEELASDRIIPNHISINLLDISKDEFPKNNFCEIGNFAKMGLLNEKELEFLFYLRTGEYDEIKVRMEGGLIYLIESSTKIDVDSKIIDIINKNTYQDIQIKVRDGKTVLIKSTKFKK